jgi:hypothetical protein
MAEALTKKNRLMVKCTDGSTINIPADRIAANPQDETYIIALNNGELVGVFDLAIIETLYLQ